MPDLIHYAIRFNVDPSVFKIASDSYRYSRKVFLFPPWKEIFIKDNEPRMTFEKSIEFHELLVQIYKANGYEPIEVPQTSVSARADFILKNAIPRTD